VGFQEDIYRTRLNSDAAMKYQYETDPEVLGAVAAMPQAQTLLNTPARRARKRLKNSEFGVIVDFSQ